RLVVDRVLIEAPVVSLVRTQAGAVNIASLGKTAAAPGAPAAAAAAGAPSAFQLASLRLRHGTLRYRDLSAGRTVELADVAVDARQPHFAAPVPVAIRARLATADLRLEGIVSEGVLELAGGRPAYRRSATRGAHVHERGDRRGTVRGRRRAHRGRRPRAPGARCARGLLEAGRGGPPARALSGPVRERRPPLHASLGLRPSRGRPHPL